MSHERATSVPEIFKKAAAFGMHGVEVDGMDVLAVYRVAKEAIARARAGEGPTLIEALTYRFRGHSLADPDELRSKEEKEYWLARDPIEKFAKYLVESGLMTEDEIAKHNKEIQDVVDDSVEFAENSPEPNPDELRRYIFAGDS